MPLASWNVLLQSIETRGTQVLANVMAGEEMQVITVTERMRLRSSLMVLRSRDIVNPPS